VLMVDAPPISQRLAALLPIRPAEEYREEACRLRALAEKASSPTVRRALLDVAADYETIARYADTLATLTALI
jgi:hypothetical protein